MPNYYHSIRAEYLLGNPLEYPGLPPRESALVLLRVWTEPAFGPFCCWTLIQSDKSHFLRRIVWDQFSAVVSPEPVTYGAEVQIEESFYKSLIAALLELELPAGLHDTGGIDGVFNGIEYLGGETAMKLRWWCEPPEPWTSLGLWQESAIEAFEAKLPATTPSYRTAVI